MTSRGASHSLSPLSLDLLCLVASPMPPPRVMAGLVPAIHAARLPPTPKSPYYGAARRFSSATARTNGGPAPSFILLGQTRTTAWMAGTSPAMTSQAASPFPLALLLHLLVSVASPMPPPHVMAGLVPAIHAARPPQTAQNNRAADFFCRPAAPNGVRTNASRSLGDGRDKPGHDGVGATIILHRCCFTRSLPARHGRDKPGHDGVCGLRGIAMSRRLRGRFALWRSDDIGRGALVGEALRRIVALNRSPLLKTKRSLAALCAMLIGAAPLRAEPVISEFAIARPVVAAHGDGGEPGGGGVAHRPRYSASAAAMRWMRRSRSASRWR